jgi:pre-mRNA-splicing helicase BRR2
MLQLLATATVAPSGAAHAIILCASHRRNFLRKFLYEPLPVESGLDAVLHDHLNAEVVSGMVETKQDAVDWLTWTLYYRRLALNPNFYNLSGATPAHLAHHLSELVEGTLGDLEASGCLEQKDEMDVLPLNLGMIASHYYLAYTTLEVFASSVTARTKLAGFLDVLAHASEFASLPVRWGEEAAVRDLARHAQVALTAAAAAAAAGDSNSLYSDPHVKTNIILQSHFSRKRLPGGMFADLQRVLPQSIPLLQALVDVVASSGWLKPALACMELSQMVVQAVWINDSTAELLQIPHFTPALAASAAALQGAGEDGEGVQSVLDLMEMDGAARLKLLEGLAPTAVADIAAFCNRYPQMDLSFKALAGKGNGVVGGSAAEDDAEEVTIDLSNEETVAIGVTLERESSTEGMEEGAGLGSVIAPRYPQPKTEYWWVVVGDVAGNALYFVKHVTVGQRRNVKVSFPAPASPGVHELTLYLMCDSYLGCDQEYTIKLNVHEAENAEEDAEEDAELA